MSMELKDQNELTPKKYYVINKVFNLFSGVVPSSHAYESQGESSLESEYGGEDSFSFQKYVHLTSSLFSNVVLKLGEVITSYTANEVVNLLDIKLFILCVLHFMPLMLLILLHKVI